MTLPVERNWIARRIVLVCVLTALVSGCSSPSTRFAMDIRNGSDSTVSVLVNDPYARYKRVNSEVVMNPAGRFLYGTIYSRSLRATVRRRATDGTHQVRPPIAGFHIGQFACELMRA